MGIDPMADAAGQQGLSPYHAMACNPSTMTDPLGLAAKTEGHAGNFIDYAGEMFRRFPTIMNFMARFVNFGERTASQSMAEQQIEVQEFHRKQHEEAAMGGADAQESSANTQVEKGKGVDYIFNGTTIEDEIVPNGLDVNRITKKGRKPLDIGNLRMEVIVSNLRGESYRFENMGDQALDIWKFLAENSDYEWSYTEYKLKDGNIKNRISTSYSKESENGFSISKINELSHKNRGDLVYWISVHSHPGLGLDGLSTKDDDVYGSLLEKFESGKMEAYSKRSLHEAYRFIDQYRK